MSRLWIQSASGNASALGDAVEQVKEFGERDGGGFGSANEGVAGDAQGGDGKGHGDAVVSTGVDFGGVESLASGDVETVFNLVDFGTHGAEVLGDERDAVGFLDAELAGVADADSVFGVRGDGGERGQLVDKVRGERARDGGSSEAVAGRVDLHGADELSIFLFEVEHADLRAQCHEHVEQRGTRGVHPERVEDKVGAGEERGCAEKEGRGGDVSGDGGIDGVELLRAINGYGIEGALDGGSEGAERELAVVACADLFANGSAALGLESGEKNGALDLCAGHGRGVVDRVELRAVNGEGRVAGGEVDTRAHLRERLANAFHGAAAEGFVADEGEAGWLRGEQTSEHTHGRARVAAVERMVSRTECAGDAFDFDSVC